MTMLPTIDKDLSSLLAGRQGMNILPPAGGAAGVGSLGSLSALTGGGDSLLTSLLLQKQAEDQQKAALLTQQLALGGASSTQDDLLTLLLRKKQIDSLQNVGASSISRLLPLLSGGAASSVAADAVLRQPPNQLESLTRLLSARQSVASLAPAGLNALGGGSIIPGQEQHQQRKRKGRTGSFPQKLHQILNDLQHQEGGSEIASFLPHGRAFAIFKPREFVQHVMPNYFRMSRFSSFQRQLNLYDFQRITDGPDKGAYYHELFVREQPMLSTMMKRNKIKGVKNNTFNDEVGSHADCASTNTQEDEEETNSKS